MAAQRGKRRITESGGRHDYTSESSLSYWQRQWKALIDAQPERTRQETIARARALLASTPYRSALHDLAACYDLEGW